MIIKFGQSAIVFSGTRLTVVNRKDFKVSQFVHKIFGDWSRELILGKLHKRIYGRKQGEKHLMNGFIATTIHSKKAPLQSLPLMHVLCTHS